jgi:predicted CxxxxCH...CXXCH cytochrome family protein
MRQRKGFAVVFALAFAVAAGGCTMGSSIASGTAGRGSGSGGAPGSGGQSAGSGGDTPSGGTGAGSQAGGTNGSGGDMSLGGSGQAGDTGASGGEQAAGGSSATGGAAGGGAAGDAGGGSGGAAGGGAAGDAGTTGGGGSVGYHTLANWVSPAANNSNQHGRYFFIANGQKDNNGMACTACHGANLEGGSAPSCASCHSTWKSCTFCHGTTPSQLNPPRGVFDESGTDTLAVGRHVAHMSAGASHAAFACSTCHVVPPDSDVSHTVPYQPSSDLSTTGNHGKVTFSDPATIWNGTTWTVTATTGNPPSARGTCTGGCHSDGRGGAPVKTPYWAGGNWSTGCGNCHAATPSTGHHSHAMSHGATCADCHDGATTSSYASANHMNGKRDYKATVAGQSMTLTASGQGVRCSGSCHGNTSGHNSNW